MIKNKNLIILISFFICFSALNTKGQELTGKQIVNITDSIVVQLTNTEYYNQLKRDSVPFDMEWENLYLPDSTLELPTKTYTVMYTLKNPKNFNYMHVINEIGGLGPAGLFIELSQELELIEPSRISMSSMAEIQLNAYNRFLARVTISKGKAEEISEKFFSEKFKKPYGNSLFIYDSNLDTFIWRFEKFKGFRKVSVEEVEINAETGEFIRKRSIPYGRNFWHALFDYRGI